MFRRQIRCYHRIVDTNGGFTVIPELHIPYLCDVQKVNLRPLVEPDVVREISLVIRKDYVREKILNEVVDAVKQAVPESRHLPRLLWSLLSCWEDSQEVLWHS